MELTNNNNNHNHQEDSSDDDLSNQNNQPVNSSRRRSSNQGYSRLQNDSGVALDQTSSTSTLCNQRRNKDQLLFPPVDTEFDETSQPTLLDRVKNQRELNNNDFRINYRRISYGIRPPDTYWNRFKRTWFRSLLTGLFLLFLLFIFYLSRLDLCSRSSIIQSACRAIITFESEGLPTI